MTVGGEAWTAGVSGREDRGRVLVVDDEPVVRRFAARVLEEAGYTVQEKGDGTQALDFIRSSGLAPDVVVSDIVMPGISGVELLRILSLSHPDLPVILMSGYSAPQLVGLGITAPCAVLAEPFAPERLLDEVRRCIEERG